MPTTSRRKTKAYKAIFLRFMSFLHKVEYTNDTEFSCEQHLQVSDEDIINCILLNFKENNQFQKNKEKVEMIE